MYHYNELCFTWPIDETIKCYLGGPLQKWGMEEYLFLTQPLQLLSIKGRHHPTDGFFFKGSHHPIDGLIKIKW